MASFKDVKYEPDITRLYSYHNNQPALRFDEPPKIKGLLKKSVGNLTAEVILENLNSKIIDIANRNDQLLLTHKTRSYISNKFIVFGNPCICLFELKKYN